jgi:hypothetical protein
VGTGLQRHQPCIDLFRAFVQIPTDTLLSLFKKKDGGIVDINDILFLWYSDYWEIRNSCILRFN